MPTCAAVMNLRNLLSEPGHDRAGCGPDAGMLGGAGRVQKTDPRRTYGMSFTAVRPLAPAVARRFDRKIDTVCDQRRALGAGG